MTGVIIGLAIVMLLFTSTVMIAAPYVPSRRRDVQLVMQFLQVGKDDVVLDIGSGDGVVLAVAADAGARAVGYEINPILVLIARYRLRRYPKAEVKLRNAWLARPLDMATIVYVFGGGPHLQKLYQTAKRQATYQQRPLKLVSYGFELPVTGDDKLIGRCGAYQIYQVTPGFTDGQA